MRAGSGRVVAVRIFSCIKQRFDDFVVAELCRRRECEMTVMNAGYWKQVVKVVDAAKRSRDRKIQPGATPDQRVDCFMLPVQSSRTQSAVWIRSVVAEQVNQENLNMAFPWHPSCRNQPEGLVQGGFFHVRIKNHLRDLHDVAGQFAVANGVFCDELQECRCLEVVFALKDDVLMRQIRMLFEMKTQALCIAGIEQIDSAAKYGVFDALVVKEAHCRTKVDFYTLRSPRISNRSRFEHINSDRFAM